MITITKEFTKEQLQQIIETDHVQCGEASALARIALASLEAEPVDVTDDMAYAFHHALSDSSLGADEVEELKAGLRAALANVAAPTAPVSVPDEVTAEDCPAFVKYDITEVDEAWARGFNACRAAMLQGAEQQNRQQNIPENIPATQFKPVADLYGLTSPTGGETSFTFDAVEARDFVDGGWSCQEYVELERFQEAVSGNSPVIQGCSCLTCRPVTFSDSRFVVCPECGNKRCPHANDHRNACTGSNEPGQEGSAYPAAPRQEVK
ncbi:TPA: hypothetical protein ACHTI0_002480 [Enterobacter kobei]